MTSLILSSIVARFTASLRNLILRHLSLNIGTFISKMKWIGVFVIVFGFVLFITLTTFESSLPLVQFVEKDKVLTSPVHAMLPPGTKFIAGTGTNGAKFVDIKSDAAKYLQLPRYLWFGKLGSLLVCALGGVGVAFEVSREKARRVYGEPGR
jgi:hypothetical protein